MNYSPKEQYERNILSAHLNGQTIQRRKSDIYKWFKNGPCNNFNFEDYEYRIELPQIWLVPFVDENLKDTFKAFDVNPNTIRHDASDLFLDQAFQVITVD
jgi:hypothetical protein